MNEFKPLIQSKTFWGAVMALFSSGLAAGHYTLSAADAASAVDIVVSLVSGIGGLVAIYGRVVASKQIGPFKALPAALLFALTFVAANLIAGLVPAMAQDDAPAPVRKPVVHRLAPPRAVRDLHVAAIQAPPPKPRPTAPAGQPAGQLSQAAAQQNPAQVLAAFALTDLQAALADAQAQNPPDTIAATCYSELIVVVQSPAINPLPAGPGAFQLFQKGRDLANLVANIQSNNGPLTPLKIACAPLVMDMNTLLIRLGVIGGAIAGGL